MVVAAEAIPEAGDTQEVAATPAVVAILVVVIPAEAVTREAAAILGAVGILVVAAIREVVGTPAAVTQTADRTMATGTPGTTKRSKS
jgi:hypothetical protein